MSARLIASAELLVCHSAAWDLQKSRNNFLIRVYCSSESAIKRDGAASESAEISNIVLGDKFSEQYMTNIIARNDKKGNGTKEYF